MNTPARDQTASLGCGTLIIIALIVLFFSQHNSKDIERDVKALHTEVGELKVLVESQNSEIRQLRDRLPVPAAEKKDAKGKE